MSNVRSFNPVELRKADNYDSLVLPDGRVHRRVFVDPEVFNEEMLKIFSGSWVFLVHEAEIPNVHDFKQITIGRRPVIVTRTADGRIHALLNRCTHRGSIVCVEQQGNASRFRCPYHGWTYSATGRLLSTPLSKGFGPSFNKEQRGLGVFPKVENYRGFVFGSLNPDVQPFLEWLGPAREFLDWAIDQDDIGNAGLRVTKGTTFVVHANWKFHYDNICDGYHVPFAHLSTALMNQRRHGAGKGLDHIKGEGDLKNLYFGHGHKVGDQRPLLGSPWERARPIPGRETHGDAIIQKCGDERGRNFLNLTARAGINLGLYPNLGVQGHGTFYVIEPIEIDLTHIHYYMILLNDAPHEVNTLRLRFEEDFNNVGTRDDIEVMERAQRGLSLVPEVEWLDLNRGSNREVVEENGVIVSDHTDDSVLRLTYERWKELMGSDFDRAPYTLAR